MTSPLIGSWHKLRRAREHLEVLKHEMSAVDFEATPPVTFGYELHADGNGRGIFTVYVDTVLAIPEDWALIIGDFLNNARSALDYLAWQCVRRGSKPEPDFPMKVAFPICESKPTFDSVLGAALPGVHLKPLIAVIREHQPYIPMPTPDEGIYESTLLILKRLNNADKHRELTPSATYPKSGPPPDGFAYGLLAVHDWENSSIRVHERNLAMCLNYGFEPETELFQLIGQVTGPNPQVEMGVKGNAAFVVEDNGARHILPDVLDTIGAEITLILSEVEPLL